MQKNFTPEDDKLIHEMVDKYGRQWTFFERQFKNRFSAEQIKNRYYQKFKQNGKQNPEWTIEDEQRLEDLVKSCGKKWTFFSERYFPNRTPRFLRSKHEVYVRHFITQEGYGAPHEKEPQSPEVTCDPVAEEEFAPPPEDSLELLDNVQFEDEYGYNIFALDD